MSPAAEPTWWWDIPAGTRASRCSGPNCRALIYWVRHANRSVPVDPDVPGGMRPSETKDVDQADLFSGVATVHDGQGVHHISRCPDKDLFFARVGSPAMQPQDGAR